MIRKLFPTVNRFFPFLFALLCVIAFPSVSHASTTRIVYDGGCQFGGTMTNTGSLTDGNPITQASPLVLGINSFWSLFIVDTDDGTTVHGHFPSGGCNGFGTGDWNGGSSLGDTDMDTYMTAKSAPVGNYLLYDNSSWYVMFSWDGTHATISGDGSSLGGGGDSCDSGETRICGFTPENGTTVASGDVDFTFDAWLAAEDLEGNDRIKVRLHNIDQNVLLLGAFSNSDKYIIDRTFFPGEDGHYSYATSTPLADGNYRLEAWIEKRIFFGWFKNPFDEDRDQVISKQFIVGSPTFIGNLSQNGFAILNGVAASSTATSSLALVKQCNPLGDFDMTNCLFGLFIPDAGQVNTTIQGMRDGILTRLPWGYFTRFVTIMSSTATTSLPSFTVTVAQNDASDTTTLAFNPGDMLAGGGALVDSIRDPYNDKSLRDIFEPIVQLMVALMVLFTIVADLTGSHSHEGANSPGDVASKRRRT